MKNEGSTVECFLKGGEAFSFSWDPGQRHGLASQEICDGAGDGTVVLYKMAVEIGKT